LTVSRRDALGFLAGAVALSSCGTRSNVRVGSKNFTESYIIAEIYSQALERAGLTVDRRFNLGATQIALAAMRRGDIDLYPEYTGTAAIDVLHLPPMHDPRLLYRTVAREFAQRYDLIWLTPSPMNDSQGLAVTADFSRKNRIQTLSQLAPVASRFRLATIQEFVVRPDGIPGLQRLYGGFQFREIRTYDIALKYRALLEDKADVASAFTTDGSIATDRLTVLRDDRGLWPPYNVAPVVRHQTLQRQPKIVGILDRVSPAITDRVAQQMNAAVESGHDPTDVAAAFLKGVAA
jgi:osmoprotectant transport system substrate-binding protein